MFKNLWNGFKSLGQRVVNGASSALDSVKSIGQRVYNGAKKIPIVGDLVATGLEKLYNTPAIGGFSAKDAFEGANKAVEVGRGLFGDDEGAKQKSLDAIKNVGARAMNGDYGSKAQEVAQKGSAVVDKLKNIVS